MSAPKSAAAEPARPRLLPALRREIVIEIASVAVDGHPRALITDPLRNAYFEMAWPASVMLACWRRGQSPEQLIATVAREFHVTPSLADIDTVCKFLFASQLTEADEKGSWQRYRATADAGRHGLVMSLLHNYLFFRIPLFHPDRFLTAGLPWVRPAYTRGFWYGLLVIAALAFYLVSRDWSQVLRQASDMTRLQSVTLYAGVLLVLKGFHELGHAFTAARYGCRVPTMGLAFMLGAPVFFTDTTDSWRLPERRQRLAIVVAGVGAELIVAVLALAAWPFLPTGLARDICFAVTTTSLVTTLLVNLNPLMRFDGYYGLSDLLGVPNLQPRAFALARWKMRELLLKLGDPRPERFPTHIETALIAYAWCTWIYRLFLFCGIAFLVYTMTVKVAGIVLGLFEIVFFVAMPIVKELAKWWTFRDRIATSWRAKTLGVGVAILLIVFFVPWRTTVEAPAVRAAANEVAIHVAVPARIKSVRITDGQAVRAGDVLFETEVPELRHQIAKLRSELQGHETRLARQPAVDKELEDRAVIRNQVMRGRERLAALDRLIDSLVLKAPFDGVVADVDKSLAAGVWVPVRHELARVVTRDGSRARSLVSAPDLARFSVGAEATFVPDDAASSAISMRVTAIAPVGQDRLSEPVLAEQFGGTIAAVDERGELKVREAVFEVTLAEDGARPLMATRGLVRIHAAPESLVTDFWRQVSRVLVREQGF